MRQVFGITHTRFEAAKMDDDAFENLLDTINSAFRGAVYIRCCQCCYQNYAVFFIKIIKIDWWKINNLIYFHISFHCTKHNFICTHSNFYFHEYLLAQWDLPYSIQTNTFAYFINYLSFLDSESLLDYAGRMRIPNSGYV